MTDRENIIFNFRKVKALGWVESHRRNNTGVGKTFEDYMGVVENNRNEPDLFGYEIKSHREESGGYITLFTKSPSFPRSANSVLRDKFGVNYPGSQYKKLHTSIFASRFNTFNNQYSFRLLDDRQQQRVYICVYSLDGKTLLDGDCYYTYSDIDSELKDKLHNLFFVKAQRQQGANGKELFYFESAEIYTDPSLDKFLKMLDEGEIMFDIRIGVFLSGKRKGKGHDHGSGFRVRSRDIIKLYATKETVD